MKLKVLGMLALVLAPVAAPLLASTHPLTALWIRAFFSRLCHQEPSRSFSLQGSPVAVCVRCLGMYVGVSLGTLLRTSQASAIRLLALALMFNLLDVATALLQWHGNLPLLRFVLGVVLGLGAGALVMNVERTVLARAG